MNFVEKEIKLFHRIIPSFNHCANRAIRIHMKTRSIEKEIVSRTRKKLRKTRNFKRNFNILRVVRDYGYEQKRTVQYEAYHYVTTTLQTKINIILTATLLTFGIFQ